MLQVLQEVLQEVQEVLQEVMTWGVRMWREG